MGFESSFLVCSLLLTSSHGNDDGDDNDDEDDEKDGMPLQSLQGDSNLFSASCSK